MTEENSEVKFVKAIGKPESKIEKKIVDGKKVYEYTTIQNYAEETINFMLKSWEKEIDEKEQWIKLYDEKERESLATARAQMIKFRSQLEAEIKGRKEDVRIWKDAK